MRKWIGPLWGHPLDKICPTEATDSLGRPCLLRAKSASFRALAATPVSNPVSEARPTVITRRAENRPPLLTRSDPDGPHHGYCPRNAVAPLPPFQPAIVRQGRS